MHSLSLDTRLRLVLWPHRQFWPCHRRKPRPPRRPPRPRRRPQTRRSREQSAVRNGEPGEPNGARNAEPGAQSDASSGVQDATSDGTRATAQRPPSRKSNHSFGPKRQPGRLSAGRRKALRRAASVGPQHIGQAPPAHRRPRPQPAPSEKARPNDPSPRLQNGRIGYSERPKCEAVTGSRT